MPVVTKQSSFFEPGHGLFANFLLGYALPFSSLLFGSLYALEQLEGGQHAFILAYIQQYRSTAPMLGNYQRAFGLAHLLEQSRRIGAKVGKGQDVLV